MCHLSIVMRAAKPVGQPKRVFPMARCVLWACAGRPGALGGGGAPADDKDMRCAPAGALWGKVWVPIGPAACVLPALPRTWHGGRV